jgi:hypothetical protein
VDQYYRFKKGVWALMEKKDAVVGPGDHAWRYFREM